MKLRLLMRLQVAVVMLCPSLTTKVHALPLNDPFHAVPTAVCAEDERTESVQGQATLAERFARGPSRARYCNLRLVGQYKGEGAGFGLVIQDKCAYYSTYPSADRAAPGAVVLDLSNPRQPRFAARLTSPAMRDPNESMEVDPARKLLLANERLGTIFDVYDLSEGCDHPRLKSSQSLPGVQSHVGRFSPDGQTLYTASDGEYYCTTCKNGDDKARPPAAAVFALDTRDPAHLKVIATWVPADPDWLTHSVSVSADGTRVYVALWRIEDDHTRSARPNGLVVLDASRIQARTQDAAFKLVTTLFWTETHMAQLSYPFRVAGTPYLAWTDIAGSIGVSGNREASESCSSRPNYGFARLIDLADERRPRTVSGLMLGVDEPDRCASVIHDPTLPFGYGAAACDVDDPRQARLLACGYLEAGLRVFDIRDPMHPKEVAYYKPPAQRTRGASATPLQTYFPDFSKDHTVDWVAVPRFLSRRRIAFTSFDNGFQIVEFSDRFTASRSDLFRPR